MPKVEQWGLYKEGGLKAKVVQKAVTLFQDGMAGDSISDRAKTFIGYMALDLLGGATLVGLSMFVLSPEKVLPTPVTSTDQPANSVKSATPGRIYSSEDSSNSISDVSEQPMSKPSDWGSGGMGRYG